MPIPSCASCMDRMRIDENSTNSMKVKSQNLVLDSGRHIGILPLVATCSGVNNGTGLSESVG